MCTSSYTIYKNCGCARQHATLPCTWAFYPELAKCNPQRYVLEQEAEGDCPECKPAFDNKSGLKPRITLNFTNRPQKRIMQEVYQHQLQGNLDEIDQEHNQFSYLDAEERLNHKTQLFLDWLDDPEHPGPDSDVLTQDAIAAFPGKLTGPQFPTSASESSAPKPKKTPLGCRAISREQRETIRARRARQRGKITPPPVPTPPATMTQRFSIPVRDEYTLKARHHILSAEQREAIRRSGRDYLRRLSIVSRCPARSSDTSSGGYTSTTRRVNLSASQRAALARVGRGNVRRLNVVGPERRQPSS